MGFGRISKVAVAAFGKPFSCSASSSSSIKSAASLPSLGIERGDYTQEGRALQASVSLQDCTLYGQDDACAVDLSGLDETKSLIYQTQRDSQVYTPKDTKSNFTKSFLCCKLFLGLAAVLLCAILGYSCYHWWKPHWTAEELQYSVVLDCGSTSTRVQVYAWSYKDSLGSDQSPVIIQPTAQYSMSSLSSRKMGLRNETRAYHRMETEPGLHKLVNNVSGVRDALEPLLHWAEKQIPRSHHKLTPLFLLGTAGMRGIGKEDLRWLLGKAWAVLDKSPFMCRRSWVKVISGIEEAYYGWVALNYKFGQLGRKTKQSTFGALDLGGSSLQVTFESDDAYNDFGLHLDVGLNEYHLYAISHTGFGLNDAFDKSVAILWNSLQQHTTLGTVTKVQEIEHPCLHTGFRAEYKCSHCAQQSASAAVPKNGYPPNGTHSEFTLVGKPDWEACKALATGVVNSSRPSLSRQSGDCDEPPCALGRHQPVPYGKFYALSGFFVVYKFFGLKPNAGFASLLDQGKAFCEKPWKTALHSVTAQPLVEQYCFRAPYVVELLQNGLHLKEEQITVGSGDMTWTLGAALLEAGAFAPRPRKVALGPGGFRYSSGGVLMQDAGFLSVFFLAVAVLILFLATYFPNILSLFGHKAHTPLFNQVNMGTSRLTSIFLSPLRLGLSQADARNGYKAPSSPAPSGGGGGGGAPRDLSHLRFGSLPGKSMLELAELQPSSAAYKGSQLSSRRTQSRDDLIKYCT